MNIEKDKIEKAVELMREHAEMIGHNRAKLIDGFVQLYIRKRPKWFPKKLYRFMLKKILVINFFKE